MAYGSGHCPQCGVKFNVRETSIGTVRRCQACGFKFVVQAAPSTGCSGCVVAIVGVVAVVAVLFVVCAGFMALSVPTPVARPVKPQPVNPQPTKAVPQAANVLPQAAFQSPETEQLAEPPIDLEKLIGLSIDEVRKRLGPPEDTQPEPTDLQVKVGIDTWENTYEKDGHEMLVTFNVPTRQVIDFFVIGDDVGEVTRIWRMNENSPNYRLQPVKAIARPGITGIKVIPILSPASQIAPSEPTPASPPLVDARIWSDRTGSFSTEARFGGMSGSTVTLHKLDGTTIKIQLDQLSESDKAWIESRRRKHP